MGNRAAAEPRVAVVGVGNEIMRDDGVGPQVIAELESHPATGSDEVRLYDAGTTAFLALEALSGCERAIVVDAIRTGAEPGTIREYRYVDGAFDGEAPEMTMHDVSFTEALEYAREAYDLPDDVLVLGVEPATIEPGTELSEPVDRAVPAVVGAILECLPGASTDGSNDRSERTVITE